MNCPKCSSGRIRPSGDGRLGILECMICDYVWVPDSPRKRSGSSDPGWIRGEVSRLEQSMNEEQVKLKVHLIEKNWMGVYISGLNLHRMQIKCQRLKSEWVDREVLAKEKNTSG